jgi:hypothetical protein
MVQVGQFVASKHPQNNEVSLGDRWRSDTAATYESVVQRLAGIQAMENWRRVSSPFQPNRVRAEEGEQAMSGVVCLLGGNSPRITGSVGSMGQNYPTEARIGDAHSWLPGAVEGSSDHTNFLVTRHRACGRDTALRKAH